MKGKITVYFTLGFILQLLIIANLAYWYTLLNEHPADEAVKLYAGNFPVIFQDQTVLMMTGGAIALVSMLFYGAARKLSTAKSMRNLCTGLIFFDAIILVLLAIALF